MWASLTHMCTAQSCCWHTRAYSTQPAATGLKRIDLVIWHVRPPPHPPPHGLSSALFLALRLRARSSPSYRGRRLLRLPHGQSRPGAPRAPLPRRRHAVPRGSRDLSGRAQRRQSRRWRMLLQLGGEGRVAVDACPCVSNGTSSPSRPHAWLPQRALWQLGSGWRMRWLRVKRLNVRFGQRREIDRCQWPGATARSTCDSAARRD